VPNHRWRCVSSELSWVEVSRLFLDHGTRVEVSRITFLVSKCVEIGAEVSQSVLMPKCLVAEVSGNPHAVACIFLFLVDIKKLLTHPVSPIIIAGGLILIYEFLLSRPRGWSSTTMPRPLLIPCVGVMAMGHGS